MEKKLVPQCQRDNAGNDCIEQYIQKPQSYTHFKPSNLYMYNEPTSHPTPSLPPYNLASTLPSSNPTSVVHKINVSLSAGILNLRLIP